MEDYCTLKFAVKDHSGSVRIFTAEFPRWNLPVTGDHILVNSSNSQAVFVVTGKTHVFENGRFKEILYAVTPFENS
jgi:hypothetical protein